MTRIVDYTNYDDMKYVVREYDRGYSRSPSRYSRRSYSRSLSCSPYISRSRSCSRSRSHSYSDRSRRFTLVALVKYDSFVSKTKTLPTFYISFKMWPFAATWELHVRILMACFVDEHMGNTLML
ncbi:hypothetical protein D0Y65_027136 [Glycine soja]|uniref:HTH araC/xylS-type domain-containing protein n=1 Tax=Glycine soja TaxID=3848 RepID=A0A445IMU2_GLYSO|nr:hypothetical protein D0Y65_027136 [Glycine soja]